jgi:hypothetical protein
MKKWLALCLLGLVVGCSATDSSSSKTPANDPIIEVYEDVGGGVGPVGAARGRYYKGPASQAPAWVKKQQGR